MLFGSNSLVIGCRCIIYPRVRGGSEGRTNRSRKKARRRDGRGIGPERQPEINNSTEEAEDKGRLKEKGRAKSDL